MARSSTTFPRKWNSGETTVIRVPERMADDLVKIARSYLARWNIEEYIRFIKQHFEIESFMVRDLGRMKNLISAVYIATSIVHLLTSNKPSRTRTQRRAFPAITRRRLGGIGSLSEVRSGRTMSHRGQGNGSFAGHMDWCDHVDCELKVIA